MDLRLVLALTGIVCGSAGSQAVDCSRAPAEYCGKAEVKEPLCVALDKSVNGERDCQTDEQVIQACPCTCEWILECEDGIASCFPGSAVVKTPQGYVEMSRVADKAQVQALSANGTLVWSPIQIWLHKDSAYASDNYLQFSTERGRQITVTRDHLMYVVPCDGGWMEKSARLARRVQRGECMLFADASGRLCPEQVSSITRVSETGLYAFTTAEGNLIVKDAVVSCYAVLEMDRFAHLLFQGYYQLAKVSAAVWIPQWVVQPCADAVSPVLNALFEVLASGLFY